MTIQSPLVYELCNLASSERHLHHCALPSSGTDCERLSQRTSTALDSRSWRSPSRGVATKFFFGGDGFIGTQTHLPPKISFSSDFGHFILKMVGNAKYSSVSRKKDAKISSFLGGRPPLIFRLRGTRPPVPPPLSTPMNPAACLGEPTGRGGVHGSPARSASGGRLAAQCRSASLGSNGPRTCRPSAGPAPAARIHTPHMPAGWSEPVDRPLWPAMTCPVLSPAGHVGPLLGSQQRAGIAQPLWSTLGAPSLAGQISPHERGHQNGSNGVAWPGAPQPLSLYGKIGRASELQLPGQWTLLRNFTPPPYPSLSFSLVMLDHSARDP